MMTKKQFTFFILLTISLVSGMLAACNKPDANGGICDGGNSCSGDISGVDASGAFKFQVRVDPDDLTFVIGTAPSTDESPRHYSYSVDCNSDGTIEASDLSKAYTCKYAAPGEYTISVTGDYPQPSFAPLNKIGRPEGCGKILEVVDWGSQVWEDLTDTFKGCDTLVSVGNTKPNLGEFVSMKGMFDGASKFNSPIGFWDVSHVSNMDEMFKGAESFNQPLNRWDVFGVGHMSGMFQDATAFNQPLNKWDIFNVKDLMYMFKGATSFNQDLSGWNISRLKKGSCEYVDKDASSWNDAYKFDISHCQGIDPTDVLRSGMREGIMDDADDADIEFEFKH